LPLTQKKKKSKEDCIALLLVGIEVTTYQFITFQYLPFGFILIQPCTSFSLWLSNIIILYIL